jgi:hypothetical protein
VALVSLVFAWPRSVFYLFMAAGWWGCAAALYTGPKNAKWALAIAVIPTILWAIWIVNSK